MAGRPFSLARTPNVTYDCEAMTLTEVVSAARSQGRRLLNEVEAKQVLAEATNRSGGRERPAPPQAGEAREVTVRVRKGFRGLP
jgi:hypothetical protein